MNDRRIREIRASVPLTNDPGVIEPNKILVEILIEHLRLLLRDIEKLDKEIKKIYRSLPDREIFDSLPGAGPQMAPR